MEMVTMAKSDFAKILRSIEGIKKVVDTNDLINEEEAAEWLKKSPKTIQNAVSDGTIKDDCYRFEKIGGKRMYFKSKLINW